VFITLSLLSSFVFVRQNGLGIKQVCAGFSWPVRWKSGILIKNSQSKKVRSAFISCEHKMKSVLIV